MYCFTKADCRAFFCFLRPALCRGSPNQPYSLEHLLHVITVFISDEETIKESNQTSHCDHINTLYCSQVFLLSNVLAAKPYIIININIRERQIMQSWKNKKLSSIIFVTLAIVHTIDIFIAFKCYFGNFLQNYLNHIASLTEAPVLFHKL